MSSSTGSLLLESKIQPDTAYQKQQETLIVWSEGENYDLALSFQEKAGCDEIWEKICQVSHATFQLFIVAKQSTFGKAHKESHIFRKPLMYIKVPHYISLHWKFLMISYEKFKGISPQSFLHKSWDPKQSSFRLVLGLYGLYLAAQSSLLSVEERNECCLESFKWKNCSCCW